MNDNDIKRINELFHKSKSVGLTEEEKIEQVTLRKAYIESIKKNVRSSLSNVSVVEKDGSITNMKDIINKKKKKTRLYFYTGGSGFAATLFYLPACLRMVSCF